MAKKNKSHDGQIGLFDMVPEIVPAPPLEHRSDVNGVPESKTPASADALAVVPLATSDGQIVFYAEALVTSPREFPICDRYLKTNAHCVKCGGRWNAGEPTEEDGVEIPPDIDRIICPGCGHMEDTPKPQETMNMFAIEKESTL